MRHDMLLKLGLSAVPLLLASACCCPEAPETEVTTWQVIGDAGDPFAYEEKRGDDGDVSAANASKGADSAECPTTPCRSVEGEGVAEEEASGRAVAERPTTLQQVIWRERGPSSHRPRPQAEASSEPARYLTWVDRSVRIEVADQKSSPSGHSEPRTAEDFLREHRVIGEDRQYDPEFFVVTLPDPRDSHMTREFDLFLDVVRSAFEGASGNWAMDRFFLPWQVRANMEDQNHTLHRQQPGVVIFRHEEPDSAALADGKLSARVVLLVGETPTWGVQREAFSEALRLAARFGSGQADSDNGESKGASKKIKLVAPVYSGAASSIGLGIRAHCDSGENVGGSQHFDILSGTATRRLNKSLIEHLVHQGKTDETDDNERCSVYYDTEAVTNDIKRKTIHSFLTKDLHIEPEHIALLVETSSYAQSMASSPSDQSTASEEDDYGLRLPFPLHIAQVQSRFDEQDRAIDDRSDQASFLGRSHLRLDFRHAHLPRDVPIPFAPNLTSSTTDLVLTEIVSTLRKNNIQAVGILATDVRDQLFLARVLKERLSDIYLFTYEADSLLTHPQYQRYCRGMLVASSFPLQTTNDKEIIHFPTDQAQGLFTAITSSLDDSRRGRMGSGSNQKSTSKPGRTTSNGDDGYIAVVSRGSFIPVRGLDPAHVGSQGAESSIWLYAAGAFGTLAFALSFLYWLYTLLSLKSAHEKDRGSAESAPSVDYVRSLTQSWVGRFDMLMRPHDHVFRASLTLALLILLVWGLWLLSWPNLFGERSGPGKPGTVSISVAASALIGWFLALPLIVDLRFAWMARRRHTAPKTEPWPAVVLSIATILVATAVAVLTYRLWSSIEPLNKGPFQIRAAALMSGLSPIVPLALLTIGLGLALWAAFERTVLRGAFIRAKAGINESEDVGGKSPRSYRSAVRAFEMTTLKSGFTRNPLVLLLLVVIGFFCPLLFILSRVSGFQTGSTEFIKSAGHLLRGLGEPVVDIPASVIFLVLTFLVLITLARLFNAWRALREVLDECSAPQENNQKEAGGETHDSEDSEEQIAAWFRDMRQYPLTTEGGRTKKIFRSLQETIRRDLAFAVSGSLLLIFALLVYPFQPQRLLLTWISLILFVVAALSLWILSGMERNSTLRAFLGRSDDRQYWNTDFAKTFSALALLPVLAVAFGNTPAVQEMLATWIRGFLKLLTGV